MNSYQNKSKLSIKNIDKSYGDLLVLDNINMHVNEGEFISVIGPSGSGKTTLFNVIAGLLRPDKGQILIDEKEVTNKTGIVAYMHQKDLLLPWKKIIDNVALPLIVKGMKKKEAYEKVSPYFEIFGLEGFEKQYPHQLSGGMRQRAALLRTYMFSNDIILLDEPFGGLDAITKHKMQNWLLGLLDELDASVMLITHDIDEAIFLSDRIYVISNKPARIKKEIIVQLDRSKGEDLIVSESYNTLKREIIALL